jgi:hypothetical protein
MSVPARTERRREAVTGGYRRGRLPSEKDKKDPDRFEFLAACQWNRKYRASASAASAMAAGSESFQEVITP